MSSSLIKEIIKRLETLLTDPKDKELLRALNEEIESEEWIEEIEKTKHNLYSAEYTELCKKFIFKNVKTSERAAIRDLITYLSSLSNNKIIMIAHKLNYKNEHKEDLPDDTNWLDRKYEIEFK